MFHSGSKLKKSHWEYVHVAAFVGLQAKLQQIKVVVCCLDGENLVGIRKDPGVSLPSQQFCWLYSCSLIAWPKLRFVYCTGKVPGWFFRHEMSGLAYGPYCSVLRNYERY